MMLFTPARTRVLRGLPRHREHGDLDAAVAHQRLHEGHVDAAHPVDLRVDERGVDVERRHDRHGRALVGEVREHGVPQVADADQRHLLLHRSVEEVADALDAGGHVVALVGAAGVADDHEVAAHLGRADDGVAGELVGVDALDAAFAERLQQPPVAAHA
jgi:hypothetical protein